MSKYSIDIRAFSFIVLIAAVLLLAIPVSSVRADTYPQLVTLASDGTQGNTTSNPDADISGDGRYVVFESDATNLVPNDTNNVRDIFVRDRSTASTTRVSVASDGTQSNGPSGDYFDVAISANGRYVAFVSNATNLVPSDTNGYLDIFVHDMMTGSTTRVSVASDGTQADVSSYDGSIGISDDGRYVAFVSNATNLVPSDTNGNNDVFVHDIVTGVTTRVDVASDGTQSDGYSNNPSISATGRYVKFESDADNLVPNDTNGNEDIFVHDMMTGSTTLVSVASDGTQANGPSYDPSTMSADGRYVAFDSVATNLVAGGTDNLGHSYVHDMVTGSTTRVDVASDGTPGNDESDFPFISRDGRYVLFDAGATNLVPGDTNGEWDQFVHDMTTGSTTRISTASDGTQANGISYSGHFSADGRYILFLSAASNLVPNDTNGTYDLFVTLNPFFVPNQAPVLAAIGSKSVNENEELTFTVSATDPDGDALTYSASNLPAGATFDPDTRTFSWTPGYDQAGNYNDVEFTVTDNGSPMMLAFEDITITVGNVNRAPIITPVPSQQVLEHNSLTFTIGATDPDNDTVSLSASGLPSGATFSTSTGVFSWTPGYSTAGVYTPTFTATDNGSPVASSSIDVVITVGSNPTPTEQAQTLINDVVAQNLPNNVQNSYLANLNKVSPYIQKGVPSKAIDELNKFITKVNQDYSQGKITLAEKNDFISLAQNLINVLQ